MIINPIADKNQIYAEFSPGAVLLLDRKTLNYSNYTGSIDSWIYQLKKELFHSTQGRQIKENEKRISEIEEFIKNTFGEENDSYFSKEEGESLKKRLDELEKSIQEKLEKHQADEAILKEQQRNLHEEINSLKHQIQIFSKSNWAKSLAIKWLGWGIRHPKELKELGSTVKEFLPEEIKRSLPDITHHE